MAKKAKKVASKKADDSIKTVTESVIVEIPKTLEDYIQGVQDKAVQFGYDNVAAKLTRELINNAKLDDSLKNNVGNRIIEMANDVVHLTTQNNYRFIGMGYQIGILEIEMKNRLRSIKNSRPSIAEYKNWLNPLIDADVRGRLNLTEDAVLKEGTKAKADYDKMFASKQRQLQKYVNLAQCGTDILKYGYCGIDGALEIRWLILDMEEIANPGKKPKITPSMVRDRLAALEVKFPFPTPDELAGKKVVHEMRVHSDTLGTFVRLVNSGIPESVVTLAMAREFAVKVGESLDKERAELAPAAIKTVPDTKKGEALSAWLRGEAERANNIKDEADTVMTPERIIDYLAKIEFWSKEVTIQEDTYKELGMAEGVKGVIDNVHTIITALHDAVHAGQRKVG